MEGRAWPGLDRRLAGSRGTPTIDGGKLYLLSGTGLLGCFDAQTGKPPLGPSDAKEFGGHAERLGLRRVGR